MSEYNLKESSKRVGELYPVLEDAQGNIIDGAHRLKVNKDWRRQKVDSVVTQTDLLLARMESNWNRRKVNKQEKSQWLVDLCEANPDWKKSGSYVGKLAEVTGKTKQCIEKYLPASYQQSWERDNSVVSLGNIHEGDFREVTKQFEDNSIDHIFTDPPYGKEYLDLWSDLSRIASRVLKPGGFCMTYSGLFHLDEVMKRLGEHLQYYWQVVIIHTGNTQIINGRNIDTKYKPLLVFAKPPLKALKNTARDLYEGTGREKGLHEWAQAVGEAKEILKRFTKEGDVILEPMAGSGTVLLACKETNRQSIGIEIDANNMKVIEERLNVR